MKKLSSIIALLATFNLVAESLPIAARCRHSTTPKSQFEQGDGALPKETGYPYPASMNLQNGWDMFVTASYLYWWAGEGGLDLAVTSEFVSQVIGFLPAPESTIVYQNENYSSGFKIGLGGVIPDDDWILRADYTRFHQTTHNSESAPTTGSISGAIPAFQLANWFYQISSALQTPGATQLKSKWRLDIDWVDLTLQKPLYAGRKFILNPFMGLRGSWINQEVNITLTDVVNFNPPTESVKSHNVSHNWGIGPRIGMDGHFILGSGVRLQGTIAESILYTNFTKTFHSEDPLNFGGSPINFVSKNYSGLKTMTEMMLGLGWGSYFSDQRFHFDLSATYDFYYLAEQNQIRVMNDIEIDGVNASAKPVFLHGLTVTATFGF